FLNGYDLKICRKSARARARKERCVFNGSFRLNHKAFQSIARNFDRKGLSVREHAIQANGSWLVLRNLYAKRLGLQLTLHSHVLGSNRSNSFGKCVGFLNSMVDLR